MHLNCFWNLLECPIFWARFTGLRLRNFSSPNSFVFSFPFFFFAQVAKRGMWENDRSVKNSLAKARDKAGGRGEFISTFGGSGGGFRRSSQNWEAIFFLPPGPFCGKTRKNKILAGGSSRTDGKKKQTSVSQRMSDFFS